jgi:hypothetical protein
MSARGRRAQRLELWVVSVLVAVCGVVDVPLAVLDLTRGHYLEGIFQAVLLAPLTLVCAYLLYRRAQKS